MSLTASGMGRCVLATIYSTFHFWDLQRNFTHPTHACWWLCQYIEIEARRPLKRQTFGEILIVWRKNHGANKIIWQTSTITYGIHWPPFSMLIQAMVNSVSIFTQHINATRWKCWMANSTNVIWSRCWMNQIRSVWEHSRHIHLIEKGILIKFVQKALNLQMWLFDVGHVDWTHD